MGINFEVNVLNKEEFLDLVNNLKEKIEEVNKAVDKINNFELNLSMELSNRKRENHENRTKIKEHSTF